MAADRPSTDSPDQYDDPGRLDELTSLLPEVDQLVRRWLETAAGIPVDASAARLAGVLKDPAGLPFAVGFIDGVIRPEDRGVAARRFAELAHDVPPFLPWPLRAAVRLGGRVGLLLPGLVIPIARRVLRAMVGHLVIDARDRQLGRAIATVRRDGTRLNLNLLGEAVLGRREATRRLAGVHRLLSREDVDYLSIKVSTAVAPHSPWAFEESVADVVESLTPLLRQAAATTPTTFINLDMEEYRDLDLTVAVFTQLLDQPEFLQLEAGIVLQAYLPDSLGSLIALQQWSAARRARGGARIKVRLVKGANLPMERTEAAQHDWPLTTWSTKQDTDTNYKRLLDYALHPDRIENVRIGVAGHNLFDVAFAWLLAGRRGVRPGVEFEMLLGMAQGQAQAVKQDVGGLLLYTPVVHPAEFDVAIAYLVRRLEEGASADNFMSAAFDLHADPALFERERERFAASLRALDRTIPAPNRTQSRSEPTLEPTTDGFHNTPDTDPALPSNRAWGRAILSGVATSTLGLELAAAGTVADAATLEQVIAAGVRAGRDWGQRSGHERAAVLRRAAVSLEQRRAELLEVMAVECGKTLEQGDPEVSEAIDFANYYATLAQELEAIDGARPVPVALTLVTPPWNFPVAIPAGSTLAALAAGSAVIMKPSPQAERCGAVLVEALLAAGFPPDVLQLVNLDEADLGPQLVGDPRIERVVLTGAHPTAELFRTFRPDLPLLAETSGKNAIVITPSADFDLAVKDIVRSAFGHAGQKCSAASLLILVGSVATSTRFANQLVDAVSSLTVAPTTDPASQLGPLVEPASGKLLHALTILEPGENWLIEPRRLDEAGQLWSPGVKRGVAPGSPFHLTEYFGPVLGVMTAPSLEQAIELQNAVDYGLTAGLFSQDRGELASWLDQVQAGNLYVNRGITGAIVRRQPFGGWKRSVVGAGTKAGGPNYLIGLSDWITAPAAVGTGPGSAAQRLLTAAWTAGLDGVDGLERALGSDARAWAEEFGVVRDVSGVRPERNVLRYLPHPVTVRHAAGPTVDLVRVIAAGVAAGADMTVSTFTAVPAPVREAISRSGVHLAVEDEAAWRSRLSALDGGRVRLIGAPARAVYAVVGHRPDVAVYAQPVTESGRLELLPFLREQAISITAHRFGTDDEFARTVLPETLPPN